MLPLQYTRRWQIAGAILLIFTLVAAFLPVLNLWPKSLVPQPAWSDKLLHVMAFTVLAAWFSGQFRASMYWRILVGLLVYGAFIEFIQGLLDHRQSEWMDFFADGLGIALGLGAAMLGLGGWSQRVENWLASRHERPV